MKNNQSPILEVVSSEIHEMWMSWAKNLLLKEPTISEERKQRWEEECFMAYAKLSEEMKELDRAFAKKIMKVIGED